MPESVIIDAVRSPIGLKNGKLVGMRPDDLSAQVVSGLFKRNGNIKDLHFHDLRHEAISRFFEKGLTIPEVALISGHKDVRMLFRYTHLKANDLVIKI